MAEDSDGLEGPETIPIRRPRTISIPAPSPARSPLTLLAAGRYADDFRRAAGRWRQIASPGPDVEREWSDLGHECGRMLIDAFDMGYVPELPGLRARIDWHTDPAPAPRTTGGLALSRCPANLFWEFVGGHLVHVFNDGGRLEVVEDRRRGTTRHGGIIPDVWPGALHLDVAERRAFACEFLADLIERHARGGDPTPDDDGWNTCPQRVAYRFCRLPNSGIVPGRIAGLLDRLAADELVTLHPDHGAKRPKWRWADPARQRAFKAFLST